MQKSFVSKSEQQTSDLAKKVASIAKKGDVFALYGTLGMGKSVFARSFIQYLTGVDDVPSPTFTWVQDYQSDDFEIFHFDLYRLEHPDEVFEIGFEDSTFNGVCLIEWPEKAGNWLPKDVFKIDIIPLDDGRKITISVNSDDKKNRLETVK